MSLWPLVAHVAVAVVGTFWAFSYYIDDDIGYQRDQKNLYELKLRYGVLHLSAVKREEYPYLRWTRTPWLSGAPARLGRDAYVNPTLNVGVFHLGIVRGARYTAVVLPCWFLILIPAVPLAIREGRLLRRKRRTSRGLCLHCGYDLRASGDCCPECGTKTGPKRGKGDPPHLLREI